MKCDRTRCITLTNVRLSSFDDNVQHTDLAQSVSELCRPQEACGTIVCTKWLITNLGVAVFSPPVIYCEATTWFYGKKMLFKRLFTSG